MCVLRYTARSKKSGIKKINFVDPKSGHIDHDTVEVKLKKISKIFF